jgi:hypothetical protein
MPQHLPIAEAASVIAGVVIPFLVALVTKQNAPALLKSTVAFALSALAGAITATVFMTGESWQDYVIAIGTAFVTNVAVHYTKAPAPVAAATPNFGLGLAA